MGSSTEDADDLARIVADACHRPLEDWLAEAPAEERRGVLQLASAAVTALRMGDYFEAWRLPESIWALVPPPGARTAASSLARGDLNRLLAALEPASHPVQTFVLAPDLSDEEDVELGFRWVRTAPSPALAALGAIRLMRVLGMNWARLRSAPSSNADATAKTTELESWMQAFGRALSDRQRDDEIGLWWMVLANPGAVVRIGLQSETEYEFVATLFQQAAASLRRHAAEHVLPAEPRRKKLTEDGTTWAALLPILAVSAAESEQDAFLNAFKDDFAHRLGPDVIDKHVTGTVDDLLYLRCAARAFATVALRRDWQTSWWFGEIAALAGSWSYWDRPAGRGGLHRQVVLSWIASEAARLLASERPPGWEGPARFLFDAVERHLPALMAMTDRTAWPRYALPGMAALAAVAIEVPEIGKRLLALCDLADDLPAAQSVRDIAAGRLAGNELDLLSEVVERRRAEAEALDHVAGQASGSPRPAG